MIIMIMVMDALEWKANPFIIACWVLRNTDRTAGGLEKMLSGHFSYGVFAADYVPIISIS